MLDYNTSTAFLLSITVILHLFVENISAGKSRREARFEACSRNPSLAFCRELQSTQQKGNEDKKACSTLEKEYQENCNERLDRHKDEFCSAYENVCFHNKNRDDNESEGRLGVDSEDTSNEQPKQQRRVDGDSPQPKDYIEFCKNYKQRFLYVCPDPVRFGSRAAVFCPIYSERCQISLPERPILPSSMVPQNKNGNPVTRLCGQYRQFATSYCNNPFALQYSNVRENCEKYQRFCNNNPNQLRQQIVMG